MKRVKKGRVGRLALAFALAAAMTLGMRIGTSAAETQESGTLSAYTAACDAY